MPPPLVEPPHFPASLRGYDREQVDRYVAGLLGALESVHERLGALEQEQAAGTRAAAGRQAATERDLQAERDRNAELVRQLREGGREPTVRRRGAAAPAPVAGGVAGGVAGTVRGLMAGGAAGGAGGGAGPVVPQAGANRPPGAADRPARIPLPRPSMRTDRPRSSEPGRGAVAARRWPRRRWLFVALAPLVVLVVAVLLLALARNHAQDEQSLSSSAAGVRPAPAPPAGAAAGPDGAGTPDGAGAAPSGSPIQPGRAGAPPVALPEGWTSYRAADGTYTLALPPGWRPAGSGSGLRFVSASGLSEAQVRTEGLPGGTGAADTVRYENEVRALTPGYQRLTLRRRDDLRTGDEQGTGEDAGREGVQLDYVSGLRGSTQRNTDLLVGGTGATAVLHVQAFDQEWPSTAALVPQLQDLFRPAL